MVFGDGSKEKFGSVIRSLFMLIAPCSNSLRASFFDGANFWSQMKLIKFRGASCFILISGISLGMAIPNDIPEIKIKHEAPLNLINFICDQKLAPSKKEARRLLEQGAISINNDRITDPNFSFEPSPNTIIKVGKRKFLKLI